MSVQSLRARSFLARAAILAFVASALSALSVVGCTPSPEETCRRLDDLGRKDPGGFNLSMTKCMARMTEMKQRDADAYKCTARTVAKLSSIDTALLAVSICDQGGPSSRTKKRSAEE